MTSMRWVHPGNGRYYLARIDVDLFGQVVLTRYWGGQYRRGGGEISDVVH